MRSQLNVLYQQIRPQEISVKDKIVIERSNYRAGTLSMENEIVETWVVDEREFTIPEYLVHTADAKYFLEDTITRLELVIATTEEKMALVDSTLADLTTRLVAAETALAALDKNKLTP